jgi:uncharacterized protein YkwD
MLKRLLVLAGAALLLTPGGAPASARHEDQASLLRAINAARAEHGLEPVRVGPRLERAARAHTEAMFATQAFTHGSFVERLRHFHVTAPTIAENLAWAYGSDATAQKIVRAWLNSPEHRRNLLNGTFTLVGIGDLAGSFQGLDEARVVTVDFAG